MSGKGRKADVVEAPAELGTDDFTMSIADAAHALGLSKEPVRKMIMVEKRIPHLRIGRVIRVRPQDVAAYKRSCIVPAEQPV